MAGAARATAASSAALPQPRRRPRAAAPIARPRTFGGVLWIVLLATLLAGVVAVNVAVLQLNVRLDDLGRERVQLRADNARLSSELSRAGADARIASQARNKLGLEPAETPEFLDLAPTANEAVSRTQ
jgi:cell division protein FtsL